MSNTGRRKKGKTKKTVLQTIKLIPHLGRIHKTKDYSKFRLLKTNRPVSKVHVNELAESMAQNPHLFQSRPIACDKKMYVIDGQHRLIAAMKENRAIYFVINNDLVEKDIIPLNEEQTNWTKKNSLVRHIDLEYPEYIKLKMFMDKYRVSVDVAIFLLAGNFKSCRKTSKKFRRGYYICTHQKQACRTANVLQKLNKLTEASAMGSCYARALAYVIDREEDVNLKHLVEQARKYPHRLVGCMTGEDAVVVLQKLYNYKTKKDNRIYLVRSSRKEL